MTDQLLDFGAFGDDELTPQRRDLPKGDYLATLEEVKLETRANGEQLLFIWSGFTDEQGGAEVDGMDVSNRKLFQREWVTHTNATAQRIGRQRLTQIGKALGIASQLEMNGKVAYALPPVANSEELGAVFFEHVGKQVGMFVNRKPRSDTGELESIVGSVKPL